MGFWKDWKEARAICQADANWFVKPPYMFSVLERSENIFLRVAGDPLEHRDAYGETLLNTMMGAVSSIASKTRMNNRPWEVLLFRGDFKPTENSNYIFDYPLRSHWISRRRRKKIVKNLRDRILKNQTKDYPWGELYISNGDIYLHVKDRPPSSFLFESALPATTYGFPDDMGE